MIQLYLVRHGHTDWSETGKIAGFTDVDLSAIGRDAVSGLASSVPAIAPGDFYSSDLIRAVKTLEILGGARNAIRDPRLRELNFGDWEGLSWEQVHQADGDYLARWSDNWLELAPPSGETFLELADRINDWFGELSAKLKPSSSSSSMIVAAHAGSIRALLCTVLGLPLDCAFRFSIDYARVTLVQVSHDGHHRCHFLNSRNFKG